MTRNPCAGSWWGHHLLSHLSKPPGAISLTWLIAGATEEGENCSHGVNWALRESTLPAQHRDHPQPCSVRTECSHHRTQMNEWCAAVSWRYTQLTLLTWRNKQTNKLEGQGDPASALLRTSSRCWTEVQIVKRYLSLKAPNAARSTTSPEEPFPHCTQSLASRLSSSLPHAMTLPVEPQSPMTRRRSIPTWGPVLPSAPIQHCSRLTPWPLVLSCSLPWGPAPRVPKPDVPRGSCPSLLPCSRTPCLGGTENPSYSGTPQSGSPQGTPWARQWPCGQVSCSTFPSTCKSGHRSSELHLSHSSFLFPSNSMDISSFQGFPFTPKKQRAPFLADAAHVLMRRCSHEPQAMLWATRSPCKSRHKAPSWNCRRLTCKYPHPLQVLLLLEIGSESEQTCQAPDAREQYQTFHLTQLHRLRCVIRGTSHVGAPPGPAMRSSPGSPALHSGWRRGDEGRAIPAASPRRKTWGQ